LNGFDGWNCSATLHIDAKILEKVLTWPTKCSDLDKRHSYLVALESLVRHAARFFRCSW